MSVFAEVGGLAAVDDLDAVLDGLVWVAPAGTTARLEVGGHAESAPELLWSARCAEIPATRSVVLLDGTGFGDVSTDFEFAHTAAEEVAELLSTEGDEVGPIEVLVLCPDTDRAEWPQPARAVDGVEFRFRHRGGADVHLILTLPTTPGDL